MSGIALIAPVASLAQPAVTIGPDWAEMPNGEDMADAYPALAAALGLEGRTVLRCKVGDTGVLYGCTASGTSPGGLGFDKAGLAVAPFFRMNPELRNGTPVAGGTVRIPIRFILPAVPEPTPPPLVEASPLALELGDRFVELNRTREQMTAIKGESYSLDAAVMEDGRTALNAAFDAIRPDFVQVFGSTLAARFNDAELATLQGFMNGPAGTALDRLGAKRAEWDAKLSRVFLRRFVTEFRQRACTRIACPDLDAETFAQVFAEVSKAVSAAPTGLPELIQGPRSQVYEQFRPKSAALLGVDGMVILRCEVRSNGAPEACTVALETPEGWGFGPAALEMSKSLRFAPGPADMGIGGRWSVAPIYFPAQPTPPAPALEAPKAVSEQNLRAAREILALAEEAEQGRTAGLFDAFLGPGEGVSPDAETVIRATVKEVASEIERDYWDIQAKWLAAEFSDADMAHVLAFTRTSVGTAYSAQDEAWGLQAQASIDQLQSRMTKIARETFCAKRACNAAAKAN